jgi:hypothetical protein
MKHIVIVFTLFALCSCGAETATTAATSAAVKKQEIAEGQKTQDQAKQKIDRAMDLTQQRSEKDAER